MSAEEAMKHPFFNGIHKSPQINSKTPSTNTIKQFEFEQLADLTKDDWRFLFVKELV